MKTLIFIKYRSHFQYFQIWKKKSLKFNVLHYNFSLQPFYISICCQRLLPVFQYCNPGRIRFSSPQVNPSLLWHWHQSCHSFSPGYPLLERSSSLGSSPYPELRQLSHSQQLKSHPIHSHFHSLILHATAVLFHDIHHQGRPVVLNTVRSNSPISLTKIIRFLLLLLSSQSLFTSRLSKCYLCCVCRDQCRPEPKEPPSPPLCLTWWMPSWAVAYWVWLMPWLVPE